MRWFKALAAFVVVAGCATGPQLPTQQTWVRMDGKPTDAGLRSAQMQCSGEAARAATNSPAPDEPSIYALAIDQKQRSEARDAVMRSCMSKLGYVWGQVGP
jgi:hypothetical protein